MGCADAAAFAGQTAWVCGGSKGIGRATALEMAAHGASVLLLARDPVALAATADDVRARQRAPQTTATLAVDATDWEALQSAVDRAVREHGVPDLLVNCVGAAKPGYIEDLTPADFEAAMRVNYLGQLLPILALLPHFRARGRGHIANCASVAGYLGVMGYASYTPAKFAIVGLTESLRHELKPAGITFSLLFPPDTDTPGLSAENVTKPEELRILSETSGCMTAEAVARDFVAGIRNRAFYIMPGQSGWMWRLVRLFPGLAHTILDFEYTRARRRTGRG